MPNIAAKSYKMLNNASKAQKCPKKAKKCSKKGKKRKNAKNAVSSKSVPYLLPCNVYTIIKVVFKEGRLSSIVYNVFIFLDFL